MSKKRIIISILAAFSVLIISYIIYSNFAVRSFRSLTPTIYRIQKIVITNGDTGSKITITDKAVIKELISDFNKSKYKKYSDQTSKKGYSYNVDMYGRLNFVIKNITVYNKNLVYIGRTYYECDSNNYIIKQIDKLYKK